jgi:methyltransferase (TIGR00027 family)
MTGARRSRTAQGVAAERALLTDLGVLDDSFARRMLSPSMSVFYQFVRRWPRRPRTGSVTLAGLAARVLWFDARVTTALDAGIRQVVVVGAGYDSRAWRPRRAGARFFELDHPATRRDKRKRAPNSAGPIYVGADLTAEGVTDALLDSGLDRSRPALFIVEGVTMYLTEDVVGRLLAGFAKSSATGSQLAVDFYPPPGAGTTQDARQMRVQRLARAGSRESLRLPVNRGQAVELVEAAGWAVAEAISVRDAGRMVVGRASGLPIESINDHKTLVAGSLS